MNNNVDRPKEYDAVLGGSVPPPVAGVVLGGIEGVKSRLGSRVVETRIAAVSEALKYGEAGLDLIIEALQDNSLRVQRSAYLILAQKKDYKVRQALLDYDPWQFFTTLANWKREKFNPQIGIADPVGTAYVVDLAQFKILLQNSEVGESEALVCEMWSDRYDDYRPFNAFEEALWDARKQLIGLKALFIGDTEEHKYMKSRLALGDIGSILEAYPNLEVLQLRGCCEKLEFVAPQHDNLKTLIVETANLSDSAIAQIGDLKLPALEYFELWMGRDYCHNPDRMIDSLFPIFSGESFPNLSYLGLRSSEYADRIALAAAQSPIIDRLAVLDMSMGTLTDNGAEVLLNCPAIAKLHTLNVSNNRLSEYMVWHLSEALSCWVIADIQEAGNYYEANFYGDRYMALYE